MTPEREPDAAIQVVLADWAIEPFDKWLASNLFQRFRIPGLSEDDLPTYSIGPISADFKNTKHKGGEST